MGSVCEVSYRFVQVSWLEQGAGSSWEVSAAIREVMIRSEIWRSQRSVCELCPEVCIEVFGTANSHIKP